MRSCELVVIFSFGVNSFITFAFDPCRTHSSENPFFQSHHCANNTIAFAIELSYVIVASLVQYQEPCNSAAFLALDVLDIVARASTLSGAAAPLC
jgi:hypothetical protein